MSFSHRRENDEKSRRDGVSDSHPSTGEHIHTARKVLQCSRGSHRPPLPVREAPATGQSAPAGARRAPCERLSARCHRKGRRLTDHASSVSVDAVFHSRHRTAAGRTNGQAVRLRLLFVLFFAERKEHVFLLFKGEGYVSISTKKLPFHRKRELFLILTLRRRGTVFALFRRSPETLYRSFR